MLPPGEYQALRGGLSKESPQPSVSGTLSVSPSYNSNHWPWTLSFFFFFPQDFLISQMKKAWLFHVEKKKIPGVSNSPGESRVRVLFSLSRRKPLFLFPAPPCPAQPHPGTVSHRHSCSPFTGQSQEVPGTGINDYSSSLGSDGFCASGML